MAMDWNLISIIVFYSLIALFFYIRRKKIEIQYKIFFLYKTKRFNNLMKNIANCCPRFWRWFGYASVPVGFMGMIFILSYLAYKLIQLVFVPSGVPSLSLVVPGVKIPGSIFIPFWYGIIALFLVIVVHEGAHGLVAAANKLKIKSSGVGMMLFLPLAFVEPDEKQLERQKPLTQLSVFAAGAFANFTAAAVVLILTIILAPIAAQAIVPAGAYFETAIEGQPAALAGLKHGDIITGTDNVTITEATDLENYLLSIKPGQTIALKTSEKTYEVETIANPNNESRPYIGIEFRQNLDIRADLKERFGKAPFGLYYLLRLFYWIFALNLGIGVINLLPLGPIDGGRMVRVALQAKVRKKRAMNIFIALTYLSLFLLLANIIAPYILRAFA